jgi:hypothetical protein
VCAESRGRHAWVEEVPERNYSSTVKAVSVTAVLRGNLIGGGAGDGGTRCRWCEAAISLAGGLVLAVSRCLRLGFD